MQGEKSLCRIAPLGGLLVLLALFAAELSSRDWSSCIEVDGYLTVGETIEISIAGPTWLAMPTRHDHVYRLHVSGPDISALERWMVVYVTNIDCFQGPLATGEIRGGTVVFDWTSYGSDNDVVQVIPPRGAADYSFTLSELAAAPTAGTVLVIPAVAHTLGLAGTFFQTDVRMFNPLDVPLDTELVLVTDEGPEQRVNATVEPRQILALDDVVLATFGRDSTTGALRIHGPAWSGLVVTSRTYSTSDSGTLGQFVAAQPWRNGAGSGTPFYDDGPRTLLHLAKSEDFRSNVGFVELLGLDAEIALEMFDQNGALIGSGTVVLAANSHRQITDIFDFLGAPAQDNARLTVTLTNHARVFSYASVVDNRSGDPMFLPGLSVFDDHASLIVVPVAATPGVHGSLWRTDLRVLAVEGADRLHVDYVPNDGSPPTAAEFVFPGDDGVLAIDNVAGRLGGVGAGALFLRCDSRILATSRTYNVTAHGTFGQFIPAQVEVYFPNLRRATVLGVTGSEDFRTNVGIMNPNEFAAIQVMVSLVSSTGTLLGSGLQSLEPRAHIQINDIFAALGVAWRSNCRVEFEVENRKFGFLAYASVIDNRSGDPIYVPAAPIPLWPLALHRAVRQVVRVPKMGRFNFSESLAGPLQTEEPQKQRIHK